MGVSDIAMAADAGEHLAASIGGKDCVDIFGVAMQTGVLRNAAIARFDADGIGEIFEREGERMEEAVVGLRDPFADGVVRQVAVVTDGDATVAGLLPRVVVLLHDVAVRAALRVVAEIAGALAVAQGEGAEADERSKSDREQNR
jgi:hypothetical protein